MGGILQVQETLKSGAQAFLVALEGVTDQALAERFVSLKPKWSKPCARRGSIHSPT